MNPLPDYISSLKDIIAGWQDIAIAAQTSMQLVDDGIDRMLAKLKQVDDKLEFFNRHTKSAEISQQLHPNNITSPGIAYLPQNNAYDGAGYHEPENSKAGPAKKTVTEYTSIFTKAKKINSEFLKPTGEGAENLLEAAESMGHLSEKMKKVKDGVKIFNKGLKGISNVTKVIGNICDTVGIMGEAGAEAGLLTEGAGILAGAEGIAAAGMGFGPAGWAVGIGALTIGYAASEIIKSNNRGNRVIPEEGFGNPSLFSSAETGKKPVYKTEQELNMAAADYHTQALAMIEGANKPQMVQEKTYDLATALRPAEPVPISNFGSLERTLKTNNINEGMLKFARQLYALASVTNPRSAEKIRQQYDPYHQYAWHTTTKDEIAKEQAEERKKTTAFNPAMLLSDVGALKSLEVQFRNNGLEYVTPQISKLATVAHDADEWRHKVFPNDKSNPFTDRLNKVVEQFKGFVSNAVKPRGNIGGKQGQNGDGSQIVNLNLNRPVVENLNINVRDTKEGLAEFKNKVEKIIIEVLDSAHIHH